MKVKEWTIKYAIQQDDDEILDEETTVKAENIAIAIAKMIPKIQELSEIKGVKDVAIHTVMLRSKGSNEDCTVTDVRDLFEKGV
jgi:hypothetical protein